MMMKIFRPFLVLVFALVSVGGTVMAKSLDRSTNPIVDEDVKKVQREVFNLLTNKSLDISEEQVVTIILAINSKHEIVVLDVGSDLKKINDFVSRNLNYKEVPGLSKGGRTPFICPVKLTPLSK